MNKLISIISFSLISIYTLTGCDCEISQDNVTYSKSSDDMVINLKEGYKFVDIKIGICDNKSTYIYTLTKKREVSEKPETYKLNKVFDNGYPQLSPKHITIIEN